MREAVASFFVSKSAPGQRVAIPGKKRGVVSLANGCHAGPRTKLHRRGTTNGPTPVEIASPRRSQVPRCHKRSMTDGNDGPRVLPRRFMIFQEVCRASSRPVGQSRDRWSNDQHQTPSGVSGADPHTVYADRSCPGHDTGPVYRIKIARSCGNSLIRCPLKVAVLVFRSEDPLVAALPSRIWLGSRLRTEQEPPCTT